MKKIDLWFIALPDKSSVYIAQRKYRIFLGNDVKLYFENRKKAYECLVALNSFLTQCLYEINEVYIHAFRIYRQSWIYFPKNTSDVSKIIENIENYFSLTVNKCSSPNSNYFVFNHLFNLIKELLTFLGKVRDVNKSNSLQSLLHTTDLYILHLQRIYERIESWGKEGFYLKEVDTDFFMDMKRQVGFCFFDSDNIEKMNDL